MKQLIEWACPNYMVYAANSGPIVPSKCACIFYTEERKEDIDTDVVYAICPKCGEELSLMNAQIVDSAPKNAIIL